MFAILVLDRAPLTWDDLLPAAQAWVQDVGVFAAVALLIWVLAYFLQRPGGLSPTWSVQSLLFTTAVIGCALMYAVFAVLVLVEGTRPVVVHGSYGRKATVAALTPLQETFFTAGGACAITAVLLPIVFGLHRLRWRRIWAIAKLSIKETVRHKILWVFSLLLLVFLFAGWFLDTKKPEFQLRNYVWVVDWSMTILLLLGASLLAAFSIPSDVRSQTIHTVVTKPVERFEIVLGRFFGYTLLMTLVLLVMTSLSLLYVARGINPEAAAETYKARVPVYGQLEFLNTAGENVGREKTHRKYISGPRQLERSPPQYAIWTFPSLPPGLADRPGGVPLEFGFDVFRTHKGEEGKGIFCNFMFTTPRCPVIERDRRLEPANLGQIRKAREQLQQQRKSASEINDALAEQFGYFEVPSKDVTDYHTQEITLPAALFKAGDSEPEDKDLPALKVVVNVDPRSSGQLVGVSPADLYLLDSERPFELNFFKASLGLWFRLVLLIGLAVALSTYLSGIISWIVAMVLFGMGLFKDFIRELALGVNIGGGPVESIIRLANHQSEGMDLDRTSGVKVALGFDEAFGLWLRQFMKLIPDVNRFDLSRYVANGFNISWSPVLLFDNLLPLLAYIVPWIVLAYYLMRYREVANPT
jgi:ABC-type transport system involved in multi-copper enzyme maturation permease subunit